MDTISSSDLYTLLAVIIFGASGIYLLLPHGQGLAKPRIAHFIGLGLSAVSLLALMMFWKAGDVDFLTRLFFYGFALASVIGGTLTVTSRDPVHSALWFAAVVLATSGLFLLSGAQFLAAGTIIVYAGAIIVTFLFVIMLAQKEGRAIYDRMSRAPFLATLSSFLLLFGLVYGLMSLRPRPVGQGVTAGVAGSGGMPVLSAATRLQNPGEVGAVLRLRPEHRILLERSNSARSQLPEMSNDSVRPAHVASLGTVLYTEHLLSIEIAGTLLFVALIGALAIAAPRPPIRPVITKTGSAPEIA